MSYNYNKKIKIKKEIDELKQKYIKEFEKKENKNKFFYNNYVLKNNKTGKTFTLKNNTEDYIFNYFNNIIQRVMYNKQISKKEGLVPYFITFTLPSSYHPFKTFINGKKLKKPIRNKKYKFSNIEEGVKYSYKKLISTFRDFYKQLKDNRKYRKQMKKMRYNYFVEYHKSFVPHLHLVLYLPPISNVDEYIERIFLNTIKRNKMDEKGNKLIKIENKGELNNIDGVVLYVSKYISKSLEQIKKSKKELKLYWGWKTYNNIRIFRGNNTKMGMRGYKKIYHSLSETEKEKIMKEVKKNKSCLLSEIEKRSIRHSNVINMDNGEVLTKKIRGINNNDNNLVYEIYETKEKHIKKDYKLIYKLFSIVKIIRGLEYNGIGEIHNKILSIDKYKKHFKKVYEDEKYNGWDNIVFMYINKKGIIQRLSKKINLKEKTIKKYFDIFEKYINIFKEQKNKIELDNIVLSLKHKEHIILKIIIGLIEVTKDEIERFKIKIKLSENTDLRDKEYFRDLKDLLYKLILFKYKLNKKITKIFFNIKYYLTEYKIYKNGTKIYDKNDFDIVKIKE
jgi:hypothetical protein